MLSIVTTAHKFLELIPAPFLEGANPLSLSQLVISPPTTTYMTTHNSGNFKGTSVIPNLSLISHSVCQQTLFLTQLLSYRLKREIPCAFRCTSLTMNAPRRRRYIPALRPPQWMSNEAPQFPLKGFSHVFSDTYPGQTNIFHGAENSGRKKTWLKIAQALSGVIWHLSVVFCSERTWDDVYSKKSKFLCSAVSNP